jgi:hypothetical protein
MTLRVITTIIILLFALRAFYGGGPTTVSPSLFGFFFLGLAALVWFPWKPMSEGLDQQGVLDAVSRNWMRLRERKRNSR